MTLNEEEEVAVIVKKTLADALPLSNTPGPVDVTGEEGFAALSLLYLDARGDLFIKEQQNQPLVWDGADITIGPTNSDHITIDTTSIKFFKDSDTEKGSLSGDTWTLGTPTAYHTEITNTGISVKSDASTTLTNIAGGNITIGETGTGKINTYIASSSFSVRDDTTKMLELTVSGSSQIMQIGATAGSQQAWQFLKLNNDRDLSLSPSASTAAATTFKVVDYSNSWKGFRVYHENTLSGGETTFLTSNVGHVSSATESVVNRLIAGGHDESVNDNTATDLFKVTIAADQFFYGTVTIISWQVAGVSGTATTDLVRKYNVFAGYRGSAYPTTKIVLLSDFNMGGATLTTPENFTVAESSNVFTFNVQRDLAANTTFPLAYTIEATTSSDVSTFVNLLNT